MYSLWTAQSISSGNGRIASSNTSLKGSLLAMTCKRYFEMLSRREALSRFKRYLLRKSFTTNGR